MHRGLKRVFSPHKLPVWSVCNFNNGYIFMSHNPQEMICVNIRNWSISSPHSPQLSFTTYFSTRCITFPEFTRRRKQLRICRWQCSTVYRRSEVCPTSTTQQNCKIFCLSKGSLLPHYEWSTATAQQLPVCCPGSVMVDWAPRWHHIRNPAHLSQTCSYRIRLHFTLTLDKKCHIN